MENEVKKVVKIIRITRCTPKGCPRYNHHNCSKVDYAKEMTEDFGIIPNDCPLYNESDIYKRIDK